MALFAKRVRLKAVIYSVLPTAQAKVDGARGELEQDQTAAFAGSGSQNSAVPPQ
jgi:hypothetical protein